MIVRSDAELARLLNLSKAAVSTLKKRGMPTGNLEEARAWRDQNLSMVHRKDRNPARVSGPDGAVRQVGALGLLVHDMLPLGTAGQMLPQLRAALRGLTEHQRQQVALSLEVWDALAGKVGQVVQACADEIEAETGKPADMSDDTVKTMAGFWYGLAAQEPQPASLVP